MKRVFLLCAVLAIAFGSCAAAPDPLGYQEGISRVVCTLGAEGETMRIAIVPTRSVEVIDPEYLAGVAVEKRDTEFVLVSEGANVPLPSDIGDMISPLVFAFSLPPEGIILPPDEELAFRASANGGEYTVTLGEDGSPFLISFAGAREFTLKDIEIER